MKHLILFVEPASTQLNIFTQYTLPRLGSFILAGIVNRRSGWQARVFVEGKRRLDLPSWIATHGRPDAVGLSTITPTARRAYELADQCKALGITVVMGGPHVTFLPDEALAHAPFIIRGEGEHAMQALLELWDQHGISTVEHDQHMAAIPNLSWCDPSGAIHHNPMAPLLPTLDDLPAPDFDLADGTADCVLGRTRVVVVQTSRGCPFNCSFCSVTAMYGKRLRHRSIDLILQDLQKYNTRHHIVFFCDDNFTADRARARRLLEGMLKLDLKLRWSAQVRADVARDPELVALMKRSGCHTVFIGFESINSRSLAEMKKAQNVEDIRHAITVLHRAGIHIHGMFVFGFQQDDWSTVQDTVRFVREMKLTSAQLLILTPLPGTELHQELHDQGRLTNKDWDLYDAHHVVFRPASFTPFELQCAQIYGHTRLYRFAETLKKMATGRWVAAGISLYAGKINRDWQRLNQSYLTWLASTSLPGWSGCDDIRKTCARWINAARKAAG